MAYRNNITYFDPKETQKLDQEIVSNGGSSQQQIFDRPMTSIYRVEDAQADWNEQDSKKPDYIKNKPKIYQELGNSENDLISQKMISEKFSESDRESSQQNSNINTLLQESSYTKQEIDDLQNENKILSRRIDLLEEASVNNIYTFQEDSSIAYEKPVPANTMSNVSVNYIGGMSYTNWPAVKDNGATFSGLDNFVDSGLTFGYDSNTRIITINGTAQAERTTFLPMDKFQVNNGKCYIIITFIGGNVDKEDGKISLVSAGAYIENATLNSFGKKLIVFSKEKHWYHSDIIDSFVLWNIEGATFTNYQIRIDIGHEMDDIVDHSVVTEIKLKGKNLFPEEAKDAKNWILYSNGWWGYYFDLPNGWYCISTKIKKDHDQKTYCYLYKSTNGGKSYSVSSAGYYASGSVADGHLITDKGIANCPLWFKVDNDNGVIYRLSCKEDLVTHTLQNKLDQMYDWQIEFADLIKTPVKDSYRPDKHAPVTNYEPPKESIICSIPQEVQQLDGYGLGISETLFNYIDFENQVFVKKVASRKYQDGDNNNETMVTNGKITIYPLEQEETIDISSILNHNGFLEVNEKEWLIFENENKNKIPSQINYQVKLLSKED